MLLVLPEASAQAAELMGWPLVALRTALSIGRDHHLIVVFDGVQEPTAEHAAWLEGQCLRHPQPSRIPAVSLLGQDAAATRATRPVAQAATPELFALINRQRASLIQERDRRFEEFVAIRQELRA